MVVGKAGMRAEMKVKNIFGLITTMILLQGCDSFWQAVYKDTVNQYNQYIVEGDKIREEHNALIKKIRDPAQAGQGNEVLEMEKEYLNNVEEWKTTLESFISFIEVNHAKIRRLGVNPDYTRDDIKGILNTMRENEVRYRMDQALRKTF